ncbi:MAG: hypothetical protein N2049_00925 [Anaerolineales bacterium]|nr:hypothetical protein [Anaerolineales bacterium]MCX7607768.1 hypothetical protein [Anaerolineales bacterium]MDW8227713.1 hypothetical protein [Anaerolineales bacterium]
MKGEDLPINRIELKTSKKAFVVLILVLLGLCFGAILTLGAITEYLQNRPVRDLIAWGLVYILISLALTFFVPVQTSLEVEPQKQEMLLIREYFLGLGGKLGRRRVRQKWTLEEIQEIYIKNIGMTHLVLSWRDARNRVYHILVPHPPKEDLEVLLRVFGSGKFAAD